VIPLGSASNFQFAPMKADLPLNVHLLSLRSYDSTTNQTILRLQHTFEVGEHPVYSKPVSVDLDQLFAPPIQIKNVVEVNLTANQKKGSVNRLKWNTNEPKQPTEIQQISDRASVVLNPMQIRTFLVDLTSAE